MLKNFLERMIDFMEQSYKGFDSNPSPFLRYSQAQDEINKVEQQEGNEENQNYLDPGAFQEFINYFHDAVESKPSNFEKITSYLHQFFSIVIYYDEDSNECKRDLENYTEFIDQTPMIVEDIIFCLNQTPIDIHRLVFELIEYLSNQSVFFVDYFLQKGGIDHIMSHIKIFANEEILLKSIQLLGEFSCNKRIHQNLVNNDFLRVFIRICNSLFNEDRFKNTFNEMFYFCSFLLKQIIGIVVNQFDDDDDEDTDSSEQLTEAEKYQKMCYQQQNQQQVHRDDSIVYVNIINPGTYKIIWGFFANKHLMKNDNFAYSQGEAIEIFKLLCNDYYFVKEIFPNILNNFPLMVKNNILRLKNKIKIYELITMVYEKDSNAKLKVLLSCIEPIRSNEKLGIPWDYLIDSISSENNKEVGAAFDLLEALFHYSSNSIGIASKKDLDKKLIEMIDDSYYKTKVKALQLIFSWLSCNPVYEYNESFIDFEFLEILIPLLQAEDTQAKATIPQPKKEEAEKKVILSLNEQTHIVILLIFDLNTRYGRLDPESLEQYKEMVKEALSEI